MNDLYWLIRIGQNPTVSIVVPILVELGQILVTSLNDRVTYHCYSTKIKGTILLTCFGITSNKVYKLAFKVLGICKVV